MKNLYKKISAVLLSVMLISVGCLSSVNAFYLRGYGSVYSMRDFAEQEGFQIILRKSNEQEMQDAMKPILKKMNASGALRQRLKDGAVIIKSMQEFMQLAKSGKRLHEIKVGDWYYLINFDKVAIYSASRQPAHKFNSRKNQRNYNIMKYYSDKRGFDIIMVQDSRSYGGMIEFEAQIRSKFSFDRELRDRLLKGPKGIFKNPESIRLRFENSQDGNHVFEGKGHRRVKIGDLEYIIHVK